MAGKQFWLDLAENVEIPDWRVEKVVQIPERRVKKVQELVCKCMKQQEFNPIDPASDQIYFCIANIYITEYTSDEDVMLLRHVLEEYSCNVKSLYVELLDENFVFDMRKLIIENRLLCLEKLYLENWECIENSDIEQSDSCCIPVLDLQKHNKLQKLYLSESYVKGLLLPVERDRFTSLSLDNVTMNHHGLEQLPGSLSSCSCLEKLCLIEVKCSEQSHSCCLPVLDLQKHNKLWQLSLQDLSVKGLLLPVEGDRFAFLWLSNVTLNQQYLEQSFGSLSSCSCLEKLYLNRVKCSEQSHSCCLPVLDLQKHSKLWQLSLQDLSVKGLLLPVEGDRLKSLSLDNVTMNHQYLEQLLGYLSSYSGLEEQYLNEVKCNEQSHSCCLPVLDLQKHNKLQTLALLSLSVKGLLLPVEGDMLTTLWLSNVTMNHQYLEQLAGSLSSYSSKPSDCILDIRCSEHSATLCQPVIDIRKSIGRR